MPQQYDIHERSRMPLDRWTTHCIDTIHNYQRIIAKKKAYKEKKTGARRPMPTPMSDARSGRGSFGAFDREEDAHHPGTTAQQQHRRQQQHPGVFVVGGAVRDWLVGRRPPRDIDLMTTLSLRQVQMLFGRRAVIIGRKNTDKRIVKIFNSKDEAIDVGTLGTGQHYLDEIGPIDRILLSNARRRDFNVNAMYYDPIRLRLYDCFGGVAGITTGEFDAIEQGAVVTTSTPGPAQPLCGETDAPALLRDPVRMLRAVRVASKTDLRCSDRVRSIIAANSANVLSINDAVLLLELDNLFGNGYAMRSLLELHASGILRHMMPMHEDLINRAARLLGASMPDNGALPMEVSSRLGFVTGSLAVLDKLHRTGQPTWSSLWISVLMAPLVLERVFSLEAVLRLSERPQEHQSTSIRTSDAAFTKAVREVFSEMKQSYHPFLNMHRKANMAMHLYGNGESPMQTRHRIHAHDFDDLVHFLARQSSIGQGAGAGAGAKMKSGDWMCISCNAHNFARREQCFQCGTRKAGSCDGGEMCAPSVRKTS